MSPISRNRPPASAVAERTIRSGTERKYSDICFRRTRSVQADLFARLETCENHSLRRVAQAELDLATLKGVRLLRVRHCLAVLFADAAERRHDTVSGCLERYFDARRQ